MTILFVSTFLVLAGLTGLVWSAGGPRALLVACAGLSTGILVGAVTVFVITATMHPTEQEPVGVVAYGLLVAIVAGLAAAAIIASVLRKRDRVGR